MKSKENRPSANVISRAELNLIPLKEITVVSKCKPYVLSVDFCLCLFVER